MRDKLVIGLETHIELSTKSKIFCSCPTKFGDKPNSNTCPVCLGLPGILPRLNKEVIVYAVKMGIALGCTIADNISMSRKNYIYPDLVKAYQITQGDSPLCRDGKVKLRSGKTIRIKRIHIEEDAGKLIHADNGMYIDYNRAGVPLIEIVTEPDFSDASEVSEYLDIIRLTAKYLGISDCKMQEGSMRSDVNISLSRDNISGDRCEIKNMNSISNIVKAIDAEYNRQLSLINSGHSVIRETLRYDELSGKTAPMRSKEDSADYRYFDEPDIPIVSVSKDFVSCVSSAIPRLPGELIDNFINKYKLSEGDAYMLVKYKPICEFFIKLSELSGNPSLSCKLITKYLFSLITDENDRDNPNLLPEPKYIADIALRLDNNTLSPKLVKSVFEKIFKENKTISELYSDEELIPVGIDSCSDEIISVINSNPKIVSDYKNGKTKALSALIGLSMRQTKGRANANDVKNFILNEINAM